MSYSESVPVVAGADLSAQTAQFKAIAIGGTIAATNTAALGILQNKPKSGEDGTVFIWGRSRYSAGGAITAGNRLAITTSGWMVAVGSNQFGVGIALGSVSSGGYGEGFFNNFGGPSSVVSAHLT